MAFKTNKSIKSILYDKDKIDKINKSGVYELSCTDFRACYIAQTGRSFITTIKEHKKAYIRGNTTSTFANHLQNSGYISNFTPKILHIQNKGFKLTLLEAIEVTQHINKKISVVMKSKKFANLC